MPGGSGQSYDVFVSYAHADNEKPLGSSAQYGWVTTLARNLNTGPNHYRKNLFIDHQLKPGDVFNDDLVAKVEGAHCSCCSSRRTTSTPHGVGKNWTTSSALTPTIPTSRPMFSSSNSSRLRHSQTFRPIFRICVSGSSTHSSGINLLILLHGWPVIRRPRRADQSARSSIGRRCTN